MPVHAKWKEKPRQSWLHKKLAPCAKVPIWHWLVAFVVIVLVATLQYQGGQERGESGLLMFLFVPLYILMVMQVLLSLSMFRPSRELRLRAHKEQRDCFAVKLTVLKDDCPIGEDEGLVFLEGDELAYEGLLTSFRVTTGDVEAPIEQFADGPLLRRANADKWKYGNLSGPSAWGFILRAHPDVRLFFFPLKIAGRISIYRPLFTWLRRAPAEKSDSILPPIEPLPGYSPPKGVRRLHKEST